MDKPGSHSYPVNLGVVLEVVGVARILVEGTDFLAVDSAGFGGTNGLAVEMQATGKGRPLGCKDRYLPRRKPVDANFQPLNANKIFRLKVVVEEYDEMLGWKGILTSSGHCCKWMAVSNNTGVILAETWKNASRYFERASTLDVRCLN